MARVFLVGPGGLAGEWGRPLHVSSAANDGVPATNVPNLNLTNLTNMTLPAGGEMGLSSMQSQAMYLHPPIEVTAPSPDNALELDDGAGESYDPNHPNLELDLNQNRLNQLDSIQPIAHTNEQTVALVHREAEGSG